jgi:hypothetical protein
MIKPFRAPWDAPGEAPFPVLHRFSAGSPAALKQLPEGLGAHPFAPIVEARRDRYGIDPDGPAPVALDPGTDLGEWEDIEWRDDHGRLRVTTRPVRVSPHMVMLQRLADFATNWAIPVPPKQPGVVDADPRLIRRVGRGGALIDAQLADSGARAEDHMVVYDDGDSVAFVRSEVRRLGPLAFGRRYGVALNTTKKIAAGRHPSTATVRQVLSALPAGAREERTCAFDGCDELLGKRARRFCTPDHAKAARDHVYRARRKARTTEPTPIRSPRAPDLDPYAGFPTCAHCDTVLLGAAADRGRCAEHKDLPA